MAIEEDKFIKDFIRAVNKQPVEYLESYIDRRPSMAIPMVKKVPPSEKKTVIKCQLLGTTNSHSFSLSPTAPISSLRESVCKAFSITSGTLVSKGKSLSDEAPISTIDPNSTVFVSVKGGGEVVKEDFWVQFDKLVNDHGVLKNTIKDIPAQYDKWLLTKK